MTAVLIAQQLAQALLAASTRAVQALHLADHAAIQTESASLLLNGAYGLKVV